MARPTSPRRVFCRRFMVKLDLRGSAALVAVEFSIRVRSVLGRCTTRGASIMGRHSNCHLSDMSMFKSALVLLMNLLLFVQVTVGQSYNGAVILEYHNVSSSTVADTS